MRFAFLKYTSVLVSSIFCSAASATPLVLDWVSTQTPAASRVDVVPISIQATLTLADDRLLTEGSFLDRPPQAQAELNSPSYMRRSTSLSYDAAFTIDANLPTSNVYRTNQTINLSTYSLKPGDGSCLGGSCYSVELFSAPALGAGRYSGNVRVVTDVTGFQFQFFNNGNVNLNLGFATSPAFYNVAGYWQVRSVAVPLPSSLWLVSGVLMVGLSLSKRRTK
jgi:hypothetical protein